MAEIIGFPTQDDEEPTVWGCGDCGCLTFYIRSDHTTECANCKALGEPPVGLWVEKPESTNPASNPKSDIGVIVDMNTSIGALKRIVARAIDDIEGTVAVVVLKEDGNVHVWGDALDGDQLDWFDRRVSVAREWLASRGGAGWA